MTTPEFNLAQLDLTDPATVLRELLDNDQRVRAEFVCVLASELAQLTEGLVACFQHMPPIHQAAVRLRSQRVDLMCAFALGVVDDLIVSTKLLLVGKVPASGNVMRQAIEGVAMALLCSTDEDLVIQARPKQRDIRGCYWRMVWDGNRLVQGQHALRQLEWNAAALRVNPEGTAALVEVQKFFHPFSHCGPTTIASRAALEQPGIFHLGGHFEAAKLDGYRAHMTQRINLCSLLPLFMDHLLDTAAPAAGAPAAEPNPSASA
ncbi:hypothetical protein WK62_31075 [Burkholderia ubonensis]|uniref:hypothetical protein n=1 Tax=Burkholderia ubonensis TaxID=101571 RepID=UPI000755AE43|nr:hypothetical protein [Burkholderia ubonensis]KVU14183.1 hypothetical protein WK62_31075 [Burkholderia ubonensis]